MYSLVSVDGKENKKSKGVNKIFVKNTRHKEFVDVLFNEKIRRYNIKRIQSKLHRTETYNVFKIYLPCFDDKRYILDDCINSLISQRYKNSIKLSKIDRINKIIRISETNRASRINRINRINRIKSTKDLLHVHFFRHYFSSIYIEGPRTKLSISFYGILEGRGGWKEKKKE